MQSWTKDVSLKFKSFTAWPGLRATTKQAGSIIYVASEKGKSYMKIALA